MPFPFEVEFEEVRRNLDQYVDEVFVCLVSEFLVMPKAPGFIEYPVFERGYEALKRVTNGFRDMSQENVEGAVFAVPISLIVLRALLGFTPPEWAYVATRRTGEEITQNAARTIDQKVRMAPETPMPRGGQTLTEKRILALIRCACEMLAEGAPEVPPDKLHRLSKADTASGLSGVQSLADLGVPYAMLLYERFLGRPFAWYRDSASGLVGDVLETAIEEILHRAGVSFRKTKRAGRVPGFDQAPDFVVPNEFNIQVIIEAKQTEDDGTARDKVTRFQHLGELSTAGQPPGQPKFEVVACIAGRGFGVRRKDMEKLLLATRGKVFTLQNLNQLVDCTRLREFRTR